MTTKAPSIRLEWSKSTTSIRSNYGYWWLLVWKASIRNERRTNLEGMPSSRGRPGLIAQALCHCTTCRRLTGSAFSTNVLVTEDNFNITSGTPKTYSTKQDSGITFTYSFCPDCGRAIYKTGAADAFNGVMIIQAGSLDNMEDIDKWGPDAELWVSKRVKWLHAMDGKAQMKEFS